MISLEEKVKWISGKQCLGCGFEVEATGFYNRRETLVGYICSCGAMVIDEVVIGFGPPN